MNARLFYSAAVAAALLLTSLAARAGFIAPAVYRENFAEQLSQANAESEQLGGTGWHVFSAGQVGSASLTGQSQSWNKQAGIAESPVADGSDQFGAAVLTPPDSTLLFTNEFTGFATSQVKSVTFDYFVLPEGDFNLVGDPLKSEVHLAISVDSEWFVVSEFLPLTMVGPTSLWTTWNISLGGQGFLKLGSAESGSVPTPSANLLTGLPQGFIDGVGVYFATSESGGYVDNFTVFASPSEPIPEPSALMLMGFGLMVGGLLLRFRRRA